jgi:hypothetical protein
MKQIFHYARRCSLPSGRSLLMPRRRRRKLRYRYLGVLPLDEVEDRSLGGNTILIGIVDHINPQTLEASRLPELASIFQDDWLSPSAGGPRRVPTLRQLIGDHVVEVFPDVAHHDVPLGTLICKLRRRTRESCGGCEDCPAVSVFRCVSLFVSQRHQGWEADGTLDRDQR